MIYTQDIQLSFEDAIGPEGASKKDFDAALAATVNIIEGLRESKRANALPILNIGSRTDDLPAMDAAAKRIREQYDTVVVFGMGASIRGNALVPLAENRFTCTANGMKFYFIDNIDPHSFDQLMSAITLRNTLFLVISKSGNTAEILSQLLVLMQQVQMQAGKDALKKHFILITEPGANPMRLIAKEHGLEVIDHDPKIGGRFASLTPVGLLPAAVAGLDIRAIRAGAEAVIRQFFTGKASEPVTGAALHQALLKKGKTVSVLMPYCDRLEPFTAWHQQLWEESLGKKGKGTVALRALGASDQHSQLQLYLDGPQDKFITLVLLNQQGKGAKITDSADPSLSYMRNHTLGDLMAAEQRATAETLTNNKRPVRVLSLDILDEKALGALMMHFMLETILLAGLWEIDPFDQPAVEQGKILTRKYLAYA